MTLGEALLTLGERGHRELGERLLAWAAIHEEETGAQAPHALAWLACDAPAGARLAREAALAAGVPWRLVVEALEALRAEQSDPELGLWPECDNDNKEEGA